MAGQSWPVDDLVQKHRSNGILIDTNLLLLLTLGKLNRNYIGRGRLTAYIYEDYRRLNAFGGHFRTRWTTPNILTEVYNLGRQDAKGRWHEFKDILEDLELQSLEKYIPSRSIFAKTDGNWIGLTDNGILNLGVPFLLVTSDSVLWCQALRAGIDAINWNHLRQEWL